MVSTMEIESLQCCASSSPDCGSRTFPKTSRDWTSHRSVPLILKVASPRCAASSRGRSPSAPSSSASPPSGRTTRSSPPKAVRAANDAGVELIAWTVDDLGRMTELIKMGIGGVATNDPRLFEEAERAAAGETPAPEPAEPDVVEELDEEAEPAAEERPEAAKQAEEG